MSYQIRHNRIIIGTSKFDRGDPSMGVVTGKIDFSDNSRSAFEILRTIANDPAAEVYDFHEEEKFINMSVGDCVKVYRPDNAELVGEQGINITGIEAEWFEISIIGLNRSVYEELFQGLVDKYDESFK